MSNRRGLLAATVAALTATLLIAGVAVTNFAGAATGVPSAPASCATASTGATTAHQTWAAPTSAGNSAIFRYVTKIKGQSSPVHQLNDPTVRAYDWTGLTAGRTSYIFQVRAVNRQGFGPWCESPLGGGSTSTPTPTSSSPTPTGTATPPPSGTVTKVLVFVEENHSLAQMQAGMPYTYGLAQQYGYANHYTAITHPSLPNYIAIAGGQTYGVTDDGSPSKHPLNGATVFGQAIGKSKTAKTYAEDMNGNCTTGSISGGKYRVKHNPWVYFTPEKTQCQQFDVPITGLQADITAGHLPNVGMVIPNLCNDAHDCSLTIADNWFKGWMQKILAGPDWASGHLAVVLTADEDNHSQGNTVLTVVAHPGLSHKVVSSALTHYSLTRFLEDTVGATHLFNAATAPDMYAAFGLTHP